jgi:hypothetical protein
MKRDTVSSIAQLLVWALFEVTFFALDDAWIAIADSEGSISLLKVRQALESRRDIFSEHLSISIEWTTNADEIDVLDGRAVTAMKWVTSATNAASGLF